MTSALLRSSAIPFLKLKEQNGVRSIPILGDKTKILNTSGGHRPPRNETPLANFTIKAHANVSVSMVGSIWPQSHNRSKNALSGSGQDVICPFIRVAYTWYRDQIDVECGTYKNIYIYIYSPGSQTKMTLTLNNLLKLVHRAVCDSLCFIRRWFPSNFFSPYIILKGT